MTPYARIRISGEFACFTPPDMKVERGSYPCITPSAARNIAQAIYWHRPMDYLIRQITVLKPIRECTITRNELTNFGNGKKPIFPDEHHTQRQTTYLRDVAYDVILEPYINNVPISVDEAVKHISILERRIRHGQYFRAPFLGLKECGAFVEMTDDSKMDVLSLGERESRIIGPMLFDINYEGKYKVPIFFDARLENGVLSVPSELYAKRHSVGGTV